MSQSVSQSVRDIRRYRAPPEEVLKRESKSKRNGARRKNKRVRKTGEEIKKN